MGVYPILFAHVPAELRYRTWCTEVAVDLHSGLFSIDLIGDASVVIVWISDVAVLCVLCNRRSGLAEICVKANKEVKVEILE